VPTFDFGIPRSWFSQWEAEYYKKGVPVDPHDPPAFESEAAYLKRLGLLFPGERKRLSPRHFWSEAIT
jgi:hypothetical protein